MLAEVEGPIRDLRGPWTGGHAATGGCPEEEGVPMQKALIIQSNGSGKNQLEDLLADGWSVKSITANNGQSYNDFLVILEK
jgi:hypothetical protein